MVGTPNWKNQTIWVGDNLGIMRGMNAACVDLIYLDPPFNSNADYAAPIGSPAEGAKFKDIWSLADIDRAWCESIRDKYPGLYALLNGVMLTHGKSMMAYLIYMIPRLVEMKRLLKETGNIYLHCDLTASHYLKMVMDALFGRENFRDEITWPRASGRIKGSQHKKRTFGRDVDLILHYSRSAGYVHNAIYIALSEAEMVRKFPHVEERSGRRYHTGIAMFRGVDMGDRPNLCYEYKGVVNPHPSGWRVSKEKLMQMDAAGQLIWREGKRPLRKVYADEYAGRALGSIWSDIPIISGKEKTGYPTQKPLKLLERIISASSNEDDVVLDPFCGCATTCIAAEFVGRQWVGIDISSKAVDLVIAAAQRDGKSGHHVQGNGAVCCYCAHGFAQATEVQRAERTRNTCFGSRVVIVTAVVVLFLYAP